MQAEDGGYRVMLMCGQSNQLWHYLSGAYPGRIGWVLGPKNLQKQTLRWWMPFALDNDAFSAFTNQQPWDYTAWHKMLRHVKMTRLNPLWVLVPDVVGNREATLSLYEKHYAEASSYGWDVAFAVQDGMTPCDVPESAAVVFVGGTTSWKWRSLKMWCGHFGRVHVGRVNSIQKLYVCQDLGIESCDGSGWFRGTDGGRQARQLLDWLKGERYDARQQALQFQQNAL